MDLLEVTIFAAAFAIDFGRACAFLAAFGLGAGDPRKVKLRVAVELLGVPVAAPHADEAIARMRVDDFAELGTKLLDPVKHYSSGMRARLAFGLSLAIEFECYLIDELVAVGDARFQQKCQEELFERRKERTFLMASHDTHLIARLCDKALIIESGRARMFSNIDEALDIYSWLRSA